MPPLWRIAIGKCTTANGRLSWTMNSWKHTSTEWQLRVMMVSGVVFTLVYSHILQTTRRSKRKPPEHRFRNTYTRHRILLASIRNLGRCPCPRCLIPLDRVPNMGMRRDMAQRMSLARVDDTRRRSRVKAAREVIYAKNCTIDSKAVENLLREDSLVPTVVCACFSVGLVLMLMFCCVRMHFRTS
jgi:hypothetical protein